MSSRRWMVAVGIALLVVATSRLVSAEETRAGGYAEESVTEKIPTQSYTLSVSARDQLYFAITDFAVGYQLGRWALPGRRGPFTLGMYAGSRYEYFNTKLSLSGGVVGGAQRGGSVFESWAWADPLIGVRWEAPVLERVSVDFGSDIGGFGASSDLIWGLSGGVRYWLPWTPLSIQPWLGLGYRAVSLNRDFGSSGHLELMFRGPTSGVGFGF